MITFSPNISLTKHSPKRRFRPIRKLAPNLDSKVRFGKRIHTLRLVRNGMYVARRFVWRINWYNKKAGFSWRDLKKQIKYYVRGVLPTQENLKHKAKRFVKKNIWKPKRKAALSYKVGHSTLKSRFTRKFLLRKLYRPSNRRFKYFSIIRRRSLLTKFLRRNKKRIILRKLLRKRRRKLVPKSLRRIKRRSTRYRYKILRGIKRRRRRLIRGMPLVKRIQRAKLYKKRKMKKIKKRRKCILERKFNKRLIRLTRWRNFLKKSYFKRYALYGKRKRKKGLRRKLLAKIVFIRKKRDFDFDFKEEYKIFEKLLKSIKRYEAKNAWRRRAVTKLLSKRVFKFGKVYITKHKRNLFISIAFQKRFGGPCQIQKIFTCGRTGFLGPKRGTPFAFQQTASLAGRYIASQEVTTIDMIFKTNMKRISRTLIRNLLYDSLYVRTIFIKTRRAHGVCRRKKKRRV